MSAYSVEIQYDKKVHVLTYEPTVAALQSIFTSLERSTDTQMSEWTVTIEQKANEFTQSMVVPGNKYRWEVTMTRRIK